MSQKIITLATLCLFAGGAACAAVPDLDGDLKPFMGGPKFDHQQIFRGDRFPTVAVAKDGTVLAVWNGVKVRRSEDGGATWGPEIPIGSGFMGGGVTVNEANGDIFAFVSEGHPPSTDKIYRSQDQGKTWSVMDAVIKPDSKGHKPEMHMNDHGITLKRGPHKGRLIRPSRFYAKANDRSEWPHHYTNAIYSDDGGQTWLTSEPFPANGTGEAAIAELSDGKIYYNSRRHWVPEGEDNSTRWTALSDDGGVTWKDLVMCKDLPDGPRDTGYGLMGGLVRLPVKDRDILIFSNVESPRGRNHGTVWASFDGGQTWPIKRLVTAGAFAYSSLNVGRPGTPGEGWIYLLSEGAGGELWRFNLSWLLAGEKTGNGDVPPWVTAAAPAKAPGGAPALQAQRPHARDAMFRGFFHETAKASCTRRDAWVIDDRYFTMCGCSRFLTLRQTPSYPPHMTHAPVPSTGRRKRIPICNQAETALFDPKSDVGDTTDVSEKFPDVVLRLRKAADRYRMELGDTLTKTKGTANRPAGKQQ